MVMEEEGERDGVRRSCRGGAGLEASEYWSREEPLTGPCWAGRPVFMTLEVM